MLCPRCYGKHVIYANGALGPCPECAGVGELHCCDGLREQGECAPEPAPAPRPAARPLALRSSSFAPAPASA